MPKYKKETCPLCGFKVKALVTRNARSMIAAHFLKSHTGKYDYRFLKFGKEDPCPTSFPHEGFCPHCELRTDPNQAIWHIIHDWHKFMAKLHAGLLGVKP